MRQILLALILVFTVGSAVATQESKSHPVITLARTACYGSCPVYTLTIFDDGRVLYVGKGFVRQKGKAHSRITQKAIEDLVKEFIKIDYFNLKSKPDCPQQWTDHPAAITSLEWEGKKQTVDHYHGCKGSEILDQLTQLEDKIDKAVNTSQWIK